MTRDEAKQAIFDGYRVRHDYYSFEEYLFMNKNGQLETEDGYPKGTFFSEFWTQYQIWEDGWNLWECDKSDHIINENKAAKGLFECAICKKILKEGEV